MPDGQFCPHYARGSCTGCTRLHVPYAEQLVAKERFVREQLTTASQSLSGAASFGAIAPSPLKMGYRTSVKLCLHEDREGRTAVGLYRQGTRDVAHVPDCGAADPRIIAVVAKLFRKGLRPAARFYDHRGRVFQKGRLKYLLVRHAPGGGTGLVFAHTGVSSDQLAAWVAKASIGDVAVYESRLTPGDGNELLGRYVDHVAGPEFFAFPLGDVTFQLTPDAFFQANYALSSGLVAAATAFDDGGDALLDLYGGFGAYSFAVRRRFQRLYVVDGNRGAIRAAERAATTLGLTGLSGHAQRCEEFLAGLPVEAAARVTHIIVNPPRNGLSRAVAQKLGAAAFPALRAVAYVSCDPATLARDLAVLHENGLRLRTARPFDMFPQTEHVETVVHMVVSGR